MARCPHDSAVPVETLDGELVAWLCPACDAQLEQMPPALHDALVEEIDVLVSAYWQTSDLRRQEIIRKELVELAAALDLRSSRNPAPPTSAAR